MASVLNRLGGSGGGRFRFCGVGLGFRGLGVLDVKLRKTSKPLTRRVSALYRLFKGP